MTTAASPPRLLDQLRRAIRLRHMSTRTEEAYVAWVVRFIRACEMRHPRELGAADVTRFLSDLAVEGRVAAATQNQALAAILFLYRHVLELTLPWLDGLTRAKRLPRLQLLLSRAELRQVLDSMSGTPRLMARILYG